MQSRFGGCLLFAPDLHMLALTFFWIMKRRQGICYLMPLSIQYYEWSLDLYY